MCKPGSQTSPPANSSAVDPDAMHSIVAPHSLSKSNMHSAMAGMLLCESSFLLLLAALSSL